MTFEPLQTRDKRLVLVVLLLIAASAAFTLHNYTAAFPQASIDLRYSKSEITAMAEQVLAKRGLSTRGYHNLTLFDPDDNARLYLEKELGLEEANRLMRHAVSVWRWRARWFQPPRKEEMVVYLSPDGRLVGFEHIIPEAAAGARLTKDVARAKALAFLKQRTTTPQRLIEEQLQQRPNRYDYVFTWEQEGFHAKQATYRRTVVIQGDAVGEYSEYLHVPEQWQRAYTKLRSSNDLYFGIATALYFLLILAAIAVVIQSLRQRRIQWRPLLIIAGSVAVLQVINQWNMLPFFINSMPTSSTYRNTILLGLFEGLGAGVGYFFYVIGGAAPGETLYRAFQPNRLSLAAALSRQGIRTREFFRAVVAGYGFVAVHLSYVVAFYLVGKKFGVWSPQDVSYSNLLSTAIPWLYPLTIALLAAASEEFWFRLFAIPLFKRYFRFTWIAIVASAFLWGFLHSNYPQEPGYIRGIEIGVAGIFAGILLLRFGILATLTWHYTIDALLFSMILFSSGSWYLWVSGIAVSGAVLIPFGICLYHYHRHGGFLVDPSMRNDAIPEPDTPGDAPRESAPPPEEPVRPRWPLRWLLVAAVVLVVAGAVVKPWRFGDFLKVRLPASAAETVAERALSQRGVHWQPLRRAVSFQPNFDTAEFEYVRRLKGARAANDTVRDHTFYGIWVVRFFKPLQREGWRVFVNQAGEAYRVDHVVDEEAAGANLGRKQARRLAETYLSQHGDDTGRLRLVDSEHQKRGHRTDYDFVWENKDFRVGEAKARISLSLIGDEPAYYRRFLKLPEQWLREFRRPRLRSYIAPSLIGAFALLLLIVFIRRLSGHGAADAHYYRWRVSLAAGVTAAGVAALATWNRWPAALASYDTAAPWRNFVAQWLLSHVTLVLLAGLGTFLLVLAAGVFLQEAAGYRRLPAPSLGRTLIVAAALWGLFRVLSFAGGLIPGDRFQLPLWSLSGPATYLPAVAVLSAGVFALVTGFLPAVIAAAAAWRYLRNRTEYAVAGVAIALIALGRSATAWQWSFGMLEAILLIGFVVLLVRSCGVDLIGFAVAVFWLEAGARSVALLEQPAAVLKWNGALALLVTAGVGILAVRYWNSRRRRGQPAPAAAFTGPETGNGADAVSS